MLQYRILSVSKCGSEDVYPHLLRLIAPPDLIESHHLASYPQCSQQHLNILSDNTLHGFIIERARRSVKLHFTNITSVAVVAVSHTVSVEMWERYVNLLKL
jgi:hypothetical protein